MGPSTALQLELPPSRLPARAGQHGLASQTHPKMPTVSAIFDGALLLLHLLVLVEFGHLVGLVDAVAQRAIHRCAVLGGQRNDAGWTEYSQLIDVEYFSADDTFLLDHARFSCKFLSLSIGVPPQMLDCSAELHVPELLYFNMALSGLSDSHLSYLSSCQLPALICLRRSGSRSLFYWSAGVRSPNASAM